MRHGKYTVEQRQYIPQRPPRNQFTNQRPGTPDRLPSCFARKGPRNSGCRFESQRVTLTANRLSVTDSAALAQRPRDGVVHFGCRLLSLAGLTPLAPAPIFENRPLCLGLNKKSAVTSMRAGPWIRIATSIRSSGDSNILAEERMKPTR